MDYNWYKLLPAFIIAGNSFTTELDVKKIEKKINQIIKIIKFSH